MPRRFTFIEVPCQEVGVEAFFPENENDDRYTREEVYRARKICQPCHQKSECLEYAQVNQIEYGIFAGFTPAERRRVKKVA